MTNQERSALILEVIPRMMKVIREEMRKLDRHSITVPQFRVLLRVTRQSASNSELADWMGVSAPTMSKMIDTMIRKGMLSRKSESTDRRQVQVECTKEGTALAQEIRTAMRKQLTQKISAISDDKLLAIEHGLLALKETLL